MHMEMKGMRMRMKKRNVIEHAACKVRPDNHFLYGKMLFQIEGLKGYIFSLSYLLVKAY